MLRDTAFIWTMYVRYVCLKGEISDRVFCFSFRSKVKIKSVSYFICLSLNKMWNAISFKKTCSAKRKNMSYGVIGEAMQWKMLKSILHILPSWYWYNVFKQANIYDHIPLWRDAGLLVIWMGKWCSVVSVCANSRATIEGEKDPMEK